MSSNSAPDADSELLRRREDARRWVRRKRVLYTIVGVYIVLSGMWLAIDLADGTEDLWFYWPTFFTGVAVAVTAVLLLGTGGLFGVEWERRQVDRYLKLHGGAGDRGREMGHRESEVDEGRP